jgi:hypothetical protein
MNRLAILFLSLFPFTFFGQDDDTSSFTKFDVGFNFSPEYSYRFLTSDDSTQWIADGYDSLEYAKLGYSLGLHGVYHFNSKLDFLIGASFTDRGERTKKEDSPSLNNYKNHYYYLDMPIRANYFLVQNKINLYASLGLSPSIFLNHTIVSKVENNGDDIRLTDNSTISGLNLVALAGFGFDVALTSKCYFKTECLYKQSISSISSETPIKKYFYGISPTIGFYLHL